MDFLMIGDPSRSFRSPRLVLVNPNTNAATTAAMVAIAREAAPGADIDGVTAAFGAPLIATPAALRTAADAVVSACGALAPDACDGVIVSAFGDPGLAEVRASLAVPAVGIAEAAFAAAARIGRFSVVTTTPALVGSIRALAERYGQDARLAAIRITEGDLVFVMADGDRLYAALQATCEAAMRDDGIDAIVIGGGPLALAARRLRETVSLPIVEPIPCAVEHLLAALRA